MATLPTSDASAAVAAKEVPRSSARKRATGPEVSGNETSQPPISGPHRRAPTVAPPISRGVRTSLRPRSTTAVQGSAPAGGVGSAGRAPAGGVGGVGGVGRAGRRDERRATALSPLAATAPGGAAVRCRRHHRAATLAAVGLRSRLPLSPRRRAALAGTPPATAVALLGRRPSQSRPHPHAPRTASIAAATCRPACGSPCRAWSDRTGAESRPESWRS